MIDDPDWTWLLFIVVIFTLGSCAIHGTAMYFELIKWLIMNCGVVNLELWLVYLLATIVMYGIVSITRETNEWFRGWLNDWWCKCSVWCFGGFYVRVFIRTVFRINVWKVAAIWKWWIMDSHHEIPTYMFSCRAENCRHNFERRWCRLKYIELNWNHACLMFENEANHGALWERAMVYGLLMELEWGLWYVKGTWYNTWRMFQSRWASILVSIW